ncbi:plasmid partitioning protein ParB [Bacillus sp. FJAT-27916]|uniref:ParB/RepB/Spo0J family partition protein n=1 Tax=Bacillaceae TaxID=186817 RepID=UPI000670AE16|nr:ParB/RepB/Spo0J family partition protein [Bacillus sp. FJAT-27916]KMY46614.1 plasmid partitioning protein ParB [Bacillus sp. FJAT-27916]
MGKGLGKGLNALITNMEVSKEESIEEVKLSDLRPNPYQPRKSFQEDAIEELKNSILQHGILQPLIVRKSSIKGYEIVAGERRFRAAKEAKLKTVPVVVREFDDRQMMELALLENLQREDLNPVEEGAAYQALLRKLDITQEELAKRMGKSRPHIANHIRLLSLPDDIQDYISNGKLSMGHGRALLGLKNKSLIKPIADKAIKANLNVRQLEEIIHNQNENVSRETKKEPPKDIFIQERESHLRERFGTSVTIKKSKKRGKIEIEFFSDDDLERILEMLDK